MNNFKLYFLLAWRNIWRNKRRTLITATSVFFAVLLAVIMRSLQNGAYNNMIRNATEMYMGYAQIHHKGYWNDRSLGNTFSADSISIQKIEKDERIKDIVPRLESFALASSGNRTKPAQIVGTNVKQEAAFTHLDKKVIKGHYLKPRENAALIGETLAKNLNLKVSDTLVLLGQGYRGMMAAGKYVVKGILHFGSPELDKSMIYLPLKTAQQLFIIPNRLTSLTLNLKQPDQARSVSQSIRKKLNAKKWEVMDWREMMPQMVQMIEIDSSSGMIMIGILYLVITFGIFGTITMMLEERKHEMGTMISLGMRPLKLGWTLFSEFILMVFLGVIAGVATAIPIVGYFRENPIHMTGAAAKAYENFGIEPIFPFSNNPMIYFYQGLIVLIICLFLSFYVWRKVLKMDALEGRKE